MIHHHATSLHRVSWILLTTYILSATFPSCNRERHDTPENGLTQHLPETVQVADTDFRLSITEQRYLKTINWTMAADSSLTADYGMAGKLAVTDWNRITLTLHSDDPAFCGANVSSDNNALLVRRLGNGSDSLYTFSVSRNPSLQHIGGSIGDSGTWETTRLTFSTGTHSLHISLPSVEFIPLNGLWMKWSTADGSGSEYEEEIMVRPEGGMVKPSSGSRAEHIFYYESDRKWNRDKEMTLTVIRPEPLNTSWRMMDFQSQSYEKIRKDGALKHPDYYWPETAERMDLDYICGKTFHYSALWNFYFIFHPSADLDTGENGNMMSIYLRKMNMETVDDSK